MLNMLPFYHSSLMGIKPGKSGPKEKYSLSCSPNSSLTLTQQHLEFPQELFRSLTYCFPGRSSFRLSAKLRLNCVGQCCAWTNFLTLLILFSVKVYKIKHFSTFLDKQTFNFIYLKEGLLAAVLTCSNTISNFNLCNNFLINF